MVVISRYQLTEALTTTGALNGTPRQKRVVKEHVKARSQRRPPSLLVLAQGACVVFFFSAFSTSPPPLSPCHVLRGGGGGGGGGRGGEAHVGAARAQNCIAQGHEFKDGLWPHSQSEPQQLLCTDALHQHKACVSTLTQQGSRKRKPPPYFPSHPLTLPVPTQQWCRRSKSPTSERYRSFFLATFPLPLRSLSLFLSLSLSLSVCISPSLPPTTSSRCSSMQGRSVCVIGSGISGLSSAYLLQRNGFKVTLLESETT
eukprot:3941500-Rhodomonas_salina.3